MLELFMQLSAFIGVWLLIGFAVAMKVVVIEKQFSPLDREEKIKQMEEKRKEKLSEEERRFIVYLTENNLVVIAAMTLMGAISFYGDTKATFSRKKGSK